MYENMGFEAILQRCLARVGDDFDKREGSVLYDAVAPAAAELAQLYIELDTVLNRVFPDTATGTDLTRKTSERGIVRKGATCAVRKGVFTDSGGAAMDVPVGSRFSDGEINYAATAKIVSGAYELTAETAGAAGNMYFGALLPIDYLSGLGTAALSDVLVPGEDEESDDTLRARYMEGLEVQAFGGNIQDYRTKMKALDGVGGVKVYPAWNGGGTVKLVFIGSDWEAPSATLVANAQNAMDPPESAGKGVGLAPIGHAVTTEGAAPVVISVTATVTLQSGFLWPALSESVSAAVEKYLTELCRAWENSAQTVVRISQIEARILEVNGVLDISGTTINGSAANLTLASNQIPAFGGVTNAAS